MSDELLVKRLGVVPYLEAWELQKELAKQRRRNEIPDVLLLLEHPPTYTRGRRSKPEELPMGVEWYEAQGIEVHDTDRGGLVTYHGPGQLVAYPIVDLDGYDNDVHAYVRGLEQVIIGVLDEVGIPAQTIDGLTGVWTMGDPPPTISPNPARKIASIGLHVSCGITTHGLAINVNNDLQPFEWIVPCGIERLSLTSVMRETALDLDSAGFGGLLVHSYGCVFRRSPEVTDVTSGLIAENQ
ncbi:MAG TPA: lipoyl(octanoyl) transferase LipB [Solirubrobacterales bacterium]|nr:lipoyl(octanoyl) transferase LipB [Solirubrobacterales bacterium]